MSALFPVQAFAQDAVTAPQAPLGPPSQEKIDHAYATLIAFTKTEKFRILSGSLSELRDALVKIYDDVKGSPQRAFSLSGLLISTMIQDAEEAGLLTEEVGKVYFAEGMDQMTFADRVSQEIIKNVDQQERRNTKIEAQARQIRAMDPALGYMLGKAGTEKLAATMLHLPHKKV